MAFDLAMVLGFLIVSALALWIFLFVGRFIRPKTPKPAKLATYECGEPPVGSAWFNFNNRFYVIALVFVAFDVAVALSIPIIVVFRQTIEQKGGAWITFASLFGFFAILLVALIYVWGKGDLSWIRDLKQNVCEPVDTGTKEDAP
jgi:NADH-quinone oxidoreductase subunit A